MVFVSDNELSRVVEPLLSKSSRNVPVYNHLSLIMLMDRRDMLISFSQPLNWSTSLSVLALGLSTCIRYKALFYVSPHWKSLYIISLQKWNVALFSIIDRLNDWVKFCLSNSSKIAVHRLCFIPKLTDWSPVTVIRS